MASDLTERLLGSLRRLRPTATHVTKFDGVWCVASPGACTRCGSKAPAGWFYCSGCAVELGRR